jgi:hypothetical protein
VETEKEILDEGIWMGRNGWGSETSLLDTPHHPRSFVGVWDIVIAMEALV